jgi:cellobiose phosphorylase
MSKYGYFDGQNREYVITNPKTPVKWINYVGTLAFGGIIDHTGGSLICRGDPALNRIVKYIPQLPSSSFKGETLYLRFKQNDGYCVFSPYFVPTLDVYDLYECHVGLGYTRIVSEFYGIHTEVTVFCPTGESVLIRDIRVTNVSEGPVELDAIPVVEYTHFDALKQFTNADWVPQTMQSRVCAEADGLKVLLQYPFMSKDRQVNYFASNWPASSFESDRARFLGDHEYGTWASPLSLQEAELSSYEALRGDNIGALLHHLGPLDPGQTVRLITLLGQEKSLEGAMPLIQWYRNADNVDEAFRQMAAFWDDYLSRIQVETPNPSMNHLVNVHNPRQCHTTFNWSRYLSLYQLGLGARGMGFRDSSQDVMGVLVSMPEAGKALIEKLLHVQRRDGSAYHQFNPLTMEANEGDSREALDAFKYYSDDHLWVILAVSAYLKETGELSFLEQKIPYYEKDEEGRPVESKSVLDHLQRGIAFTRNNVGAHGLPLLGFADWNDATNLKKGAESLFVANLYGKALLEMIDLARFLGDRDLVEKFMAYHQEMEERVNASAWDGAWYVRYFNADGSPIGSSVNEYGQIYANAQSWPVISRFAPPERAQSALDALYERLNTPKGIRLSMPGYNGYDPDKGGVTTYPPSTKENGGIFLHTNPWVMIAETLVGNGNRAFEYYDQINPAAKNEAVDEFESEPYVYPQNILADEHPQFGLARNSWLTGTASWCYQAATQYILGIRPTYDGLLIDPCIPDTWEGFRASRVFRGTTYEIEVKNPDHVCKGVRSVRVDGDEVEGQVLPTLSDGGAHKVEVVMGQ